VTVSDLPLFRDVEEDEFLLRLDRAMQKLDKLEKKWEEDDARKVAPERRED